jgi:hypothetical protein
MVEMHPPPIFHAAAPASNPLSGPRIVVSFSSAPGPVQGECSKGSGDDESAKERSGRTGGENRKGSVRRSLSNDGGWCPGTESNRRHEDFQSSALPTELPGQVRFGSFPRAANDSGAARSCQFGPQSELPVKPRELDLYFSRGKPAGQRPGFSSPGHAAHRPAPAGGWPPGRAARAQATRCRSAPRSAGGLLRFQQAGRR